MDKKPEFKSALQVKEGIPQPPSINPAVLTKSVRRRKKKYSADEFVSGILSGDRTILSQAITLVESSLPQHYETAQVIIEKCLPFSSKSIRIGITGVPGAGKSTFIESFGLHITREGRKLAVLTIDPSSEQTKGSILGDKTRMEQLSVHPHAFIRPSPTTGALGGVARKTRETIILCEAAGFDIIFVETVGVGQSETAVHSMVDFFLLLMLAGAGDELQGIKRGIMEMADAIVINKADGDNIPKADLAAREYKNALHLFPASPSGWSPRVMTASSVDGKGILDVWKMISNYKKLTFSSGYFDRRRKEQALQAFTDTIEETIRQKFYNHTSVSKQLDAIRQDILSGKISPYAAAQQLMAGYSY